MNRDPRLLYGADIRNRILDEVAADWGAAAGI